MSQIKYIYIFTFNNKSTFTILYQIKKNKRKPEQQKQTIYI